MKILIIILLICMTACTTPAMIMKSWVGHSESELYQHWEHHAELLIMTLMAKL
jgi:hypothetical protein